jgi:hypothetical protein
MISALVHALSRCRGDPVDTIATFAVCKIAVEVQDPVCKHGGYLRAENHTAEPTSCADCICPAEWDGIDCARASWRAVRGMPAVISCANAFSVQDGMGGQPAT